MPLCETCLSAVVKLRPIAGAEGQPSDLPRLPWTAKAVLPTFDQDRVAGCWLCLKFARSLQEIDPTLYRGWHTRSLRVAYDAIGRGISPDLPRHILPFILTMTPQDEESHGIGCDAEVNFINAQDYMEPAKSSADYCDQHCSVNMDLVHTWISNCSQNHENCNRDSDVPKWYPTRILYLDERTQTVKLIITDEKRPQGHYMTLSHRWGEMPYVQLTASTMAQLQNRVEVGGLPQIFQDTISLAYRLNIHYLWIDALCIKQNDRHDWEIESLTMGKVYANAFINISATSSSDGTESLFQQRFHGPISPTEIELDICGVTERYFVIDGDFWLDEINHEPLMKRGWVFQERFLARRVLHFGPRQIGWECSQLDALEMLPAGIPKYLIHSEMTKMGLHDDLVTLTRNPSNLSKFAYQWQVLVKEYSKCELTFPKDKLIAFAGVAERMTACNTSRYVAGMWENTLIYDLAWWRLSEDQERYPISETRYRAPSWSWASVNGEINFADHVGGNQNEFIKSCHFSTNTSDLNQMAGCKFFIHMEAYCVPLQLYWSDDDHDDDCIIGIGVAKLFFNVERDGEGDSAISVEGSVHQLRQLSQEGKLMLLPIFASGYHFYGMIVRKIRGIAAHRRIGLVQLVAVKDSGKIPSNSEDENETSLTGEQNPSKPNARQERRRGRRQDKWIESKRIKQANSVSGRVMYNVTVYSLMLDLRKRRRTRMLKLY